MRKLFTLFFLACSLIQPLLSFSQTSNKTHSPSSPLRAMAEWEEVEYVVVTWAQHLSVVSEVIRNAQRECDIIIVCTDSNRVKQYLKERKVPVKRIHYLISPYNSVWIRDYGANSVYSQDTDSLYLLDWIYNRPRPYDDKLSHSIARFTGLPLYETTLPPNDLVQIGGNFITDGLGTGFSSRLIVKENSRNGKFNPSVKSEDEINRIMRQYMGIDRYVKLNMLTHDGIHHIDMHMNFLDEETLLVGEYPEGVADGPLIEANMADLLHSYPSSFGTPWRVVRIPMPPHNGAYPDTWWAHYRTYTNLVFINRSVLVPIYEEKYDTTALRILRKELPGYHIVGIDCSTLIRSGGALRCITRTIGVKHPLRIIHRPLRATYRADSILTIAATIQHRSGIKEAFLHYSLEEGKGYQSIPMIVSDTLRTKWSVMIPSLPAGASVFYYISAKSNSGKVYQRPVTAPKGYWQFQLQECEGCIPNR